MCFWRVFAIKPDSQWFQIAQTLPKEFPLKWFHELFTQTSAYTWNFRFRSFHFSSYSKNMSNCCRQKYEQSISRMFQPNVWRIYAIWSHRATVLRRNEKSDENKWLTAISQSNSFVQFPVNHTFLNMKVDPTDPQWFQELFKSSFRRFILFPFPVIEYAFDDFLL